MSGTRWTKEQLADYEARRIRRESVTRNQKRENEHQLNTQIPDAKPAQHAPALATDDAREAQCPSCPTVRFTLCRVRLLDVDAKYGSIKDLLDGLQYAGLIHGDKEGEINLQVHQRKVAHYADERTEIAIEEINP